MDIQYGCPFHWKPLYRISKSDPFFGGIQKKVEQKIDVEYFFFKNRNYLVRGTTYPKGSF